MGSIDFESAIERVRAYGAAHFASLASIGVRGMSVLAGFAITFYIGHTMGPLANGQYALVTQTAIFLSIVAVGGMDLAVVRQFSAAIAQNVPLAAASFWRVMIYTLVAASLIMVVLIAVGNAGLRILFGENVPADTLALLCIIMVARTSTRLLAAVLRAQQAYLIAQTIEVLAIPMIVGISIVTGIVYGLDRLLWATAIAGLLTALYGIVRVLRKTTTKPEGLDVPLRPLLQMSLPLWATAISLNIADWYSLATAATALSVYDAGLFRVAFQIGGALSFVAMGMYNVFTAQISQALADGNFERVAKLSRAATRLAALCVGPVVVALLVFADAILALIKPEFMAAASVLRIIVIAQGLYILTGPAGLVLAMSGHQRMNLLVSVCGTGSLLIVAPIAAQMWGLTGLATLVGLVLLSNNLVSLYLVWRLEGINVMTGGLRPRPDPVETPAPIETRD